VFHSGPTTKIQSGDTSTPVLQKPKKSPRLAAQASPSLDHGISPNNVGEGVPKPVSTTVKKACQKGKKNGSKARKKRPYENKTRRKPGQAKWMGEKKTSWETRGRCDRVGGKSEATGRKGKTPGSPSSVKRGLQTFKKQQSGRRRASRTPPSKKAGADIASHRLEEVTIKNRKIKGSQSIGVIPAKIKVT